MDAIRTAGLSRDFGATHAVGDLTLSVAPGELFGLVGPDGAGKTTVLRLLAGLLAPSSGEAWVDGHQVAREARAARASLGYMSQRFGLYADLTVQENLDFFADIQGVPRRERTQRREHLLSFTQLAPFRRRLAGNLSGGMKQKLGLACALIHTPRVLLLDEPTNGVDPISRREFWRFLYQLARSGVTVFLSTTYLDEAERCGRLALLHGGRLLAAGTPDDLRRRSPCSVLHLRTDTPRAAIPLLRQAFGAAAVQRCGDRLHLTVPTAAAAGAPAQARDVLAQAGVTVTGIEALPPSLEDVMVAELGRVVEPDPA